MALIEGRANDRITARADRLLTGVHLGAGVQIVASGIILEYRIGTTNPDHTFIGCTGITVIANNVRICAALVPITYVRRADVHIFTIAILPTGLAQEAAAPGIIHTPATHLVRHCLTSKARRAFVGHGDTYVLQTILHNG